MCEGYRTSNLYPGGFSESFLVPRWNVEKGGVLTVPNRLSFEEASLIEPTACCIRAMEKCDVKPGESVLVAGAGPVGMTHSLILKSMGASVLVSDISEDRLLFAEKSKVGRVLNAAKEDVPSFAKSETAGKGVDVAIVASGSPRAITQALRSVRRGGRVCLFGVPTKNSVLDYDFSDLYNSEQKIITSYGATETDTVKAMGLLASGRVDFKGLITHVFPLSRFQEAVEEAESGRAMKVVVTP
jgi:L-iditol 2-dehydrogenase